MNIEERKEIFKYALQKAVDKDTLTKKEINNSEFLSGYNLISDKISEYIPVRNVELNYFDEKQKYVDIEILLDETEEEYDLFLLIRYYIENPEIIDFYISDVYLDLYKKKNVNLKESIKLISEYLSFEIFKTQED